MKKILIALLFLPFYTNAQIGGTLHCGFDFTSYFVVNAHEDGKTQQINGLKIYIANSEGKEVINVNNSLSWKNGNLPMLFTRNYKIDNSNKRISDNEEGKWFYYFAEDYYLLSVANTFPADAYFIKIEDVDGEENGGYFKTQLVQLAPYNMYVLCSAEERNKIVQFGKRMNKPIDIVMEKN